VDIYEIMDAVHRLGSIKQAAAEVRKSYRYVWNRIKEVEATLGYNLVEARLGGVGTRRSFLTDRARKLVKDFLDLRTRISEAITDEFAAIFGS
jgi:molybdate transport system regulatory protein